MSGNDAYTVALLHCDGSDASTTFTDVNFGGSAHTWTANGNAQVDTAQSVFGGASLLLDGTGDYIDTPDSANWALGSGDFTIDCWFYRNGGDGASRYITAIFDSAGGVNSDFSFGIKLHTDNKIIAQVNSGTTITQVLGTTAYTSAGWHHLAFVRTGNTLKLFLDGTQEGGNVAFSSSINDSTKKLAVGRAGEFDGLYFNGWIDEFRISKGIARWTANFTPPTEAYDAVVEGVGTATGAGSAAGVGASIFAAAGSAAGSAAGAAVGESTVAAAGSASGFADAQAVGTAVTPAAGLATGSATAEAVGTAVTPTVGLAAGSSSVNGVSIILPIISTKALQMPVDYVLAAQQSETRGRSPLTRPGRADYRSLRSIFRE